MLSLKEAKDVQLEMIGAEVERLRQSNVSPHEGNQSCKKEIADLTLRLNELELQKTDNLAIIGKLEFEAKQQASNDIEQLRSYYNQLNEDNTKKHSKEMMKLR